LTPIGNCQKKTVATAARNSTGAAAVAVDKKTLRMLAVEFAGILLQNLAIVATGAVEAIAAAGSHRTAVTRVVLVTSYQKD
jgi:hypothetical protein